MTKKVNLSEIAHVLLQRDNFIVTGHIDPDPDCLGSMGAMWLALTSLGKKVEVVLPGPIPKSLRFIPGIPGESRRETGMSFGKEGWTAVVLDCDPDRTGAAREVVEKADLVINLDHHRTNRAQGDLSYVAVEAAATGEIVYDLLTAMKVAWSSEMATALYAAIFGDTGSFCFSNTTERTFRIAGDLVSKGALPNQVAQQILERKPFDYVKLIGACIETLEMSPDGRIAWILVTKDMLSEYDLSPSEIEGLVKYPRMIDKVEVALIFREQEHGVKVGFRSRSVVDVSEIARSFGGGGHVRASGCTIEAPLNEAVARVLDAVAKSIAEAERKGRLE